MATKTSCVTYDDVTMIVATDYGPGIVDNTETYYNVGFVDSSGTFYNVGILDNTGTFYNVGILDSTGTFYNVGILDSSGTHTAEIIIPAADQVLSPTIVYGIDIAGNLTQVTGTATAGGGGSGENGTALIVL